MKKAIRFAQHGGQSRNLALGLHRAIRGVLWMILTLGSLVYAPVTELANAQMRTPVFNAGYSPASMNTSNLPQAQVIHYDKNFVKNLKTNTPHVRCTNRRELPENSGNQLELFMYQTLGANITQQAEGTVGSGITVSVLTNKTTIGNYADYVNLSHMARITAIDPTLENIQKEMAYRLALSTNTIVKNTADGAAAIDSSVSAGNLAANVSFTRSTITTAVASLQGRSVQPFENGRMCGVIHDFIVGDDLNDTTVGGVTDILKRTTEGQEKLSELPSPDGDSVPVLDWGGTSFYRSNIVTQTPNYLGSGKTALRTYIYGENGVITISLGKKEMAQIGDGDWRNLKLWMYKTDEPSGSDPARVIGGWTSYNVYFAATLVPDTVMRNRTIDAVATVS